MLSVEELFELEDNIREELDDHLTAALASLNRSGQLEELLQLLGWNTSSKKKRDMRCTKLARSLLSVSLM